MLRDEKCGPPDWTAHESAGGDFVECGFLCACELSAENTGSTDKAGRHKGEAAGLWNGAVIGGRGLRLRIGEVEGAGAGPDAAVEVDLGYVAVDARAETEEGAEGDVTEGDICEGEGKALARRCVMEEDVDGDAGFGDGQKAKTVDIGIGCSKGFEARAEEIGAEMGVVEDFAVQDGGTVDDGGSAAGGDGSGD